MPRLRLNEEDNKDTTLSFSNRFAFYERNEFQERIRDYTDVYGYRLTMRSSLDSAFRMYLLAKTEYTLDDIIDMEKFSWRELKTHFQDFLNMLDYTKRDKASCAKDLAAMHKAAMGKILNYRVPDYYLGNIEYLNKVSNALNVIQILSTDFSQDMQDLFSGVNEHMEDITEVRQAYEEVYPRSSVEEDSMKLDAFCHSIAYPVNKACEFYKDGNLKAASVAMDMARQSVDEWKGKAIGEIDPVSVNAFPLVVTKVVPKLSRLTGTDDEYEDYLTGVTNTYPGKNRLTEILREIEDEDMIRDFPRKMKEKLEKLSDVSLTPIQGLFTEEMPENLTELPDNQKKALEKMYRDFFEAIYKGVEFQQARAAGLDAFDLIMTENGSIREVFGNRYENLSKEEQILAFKLETLRYLALHPQGLTCRWTVAQPVRKENRETYEMAVSEESVTIKPGISAKEFRYEVPDPIPGSIPSSQDARLFLSAPEAGLPDSIKNASDAIEGSLDTFYSAHGQIFAKNHMDMFDCIYIGDQTVNEIFAETISNIPDSERIVKEYKLGILVASQFQVNKPIFMTSLREDAQGKLVKEVVPVTFAGNGFTALRANNPEAIRTKGKEILRNREELYAKPEEAKQKLYSDASEKIREKLKNPFMDAMEKRLLNVRLGLSLMPPYFSAQLDEIMPELEAMVNEMNEATREYRTYLLASKMSSDAGIRREFEQKATEILNKPPISDYENYMRILEVTAGIRPFDTTLPEDRALLNFCMEKKNHPILPGKPSVIHETEAIFGKAADIKGNDGKIRDYLENTYLKLHYAMNDRNLFASQILIGGETAESLLPTYLREADLKSEEMKKLYINAVTGLITTALRDGKPVDLYLRDPKNHTLLPIPVRVKSSDTVRLNVQTRESYQREQEAGHERLANAFRMSQFAPETYRVNREILKKNKEHDFRVALERSVAYYDTISVNALKNQYFPNGVTVNQGAKKADPEGEFTIRNKRGNGINYVLMRLCEESLERKANNKQGYTIDELFDLNALKEAKEKYAAEYIEICEKYDHKTFLENLYKGMQAVRKYYREEVLNVELAKNPVDYNKLFLGKGGYLGGSLNHDLYQEMYLQENLTYLTNHIFGGDVAQRNRFEKEIEFGSALDVFNTIGFDGTVLKNDFADSGMGQAFFLEPVFRDMMVKETMQCAKELGDDPLRELVMTSRGMQGLDYSELLETPVMRQILSAPNASEKIYNGTIFENVFLDIGRIIRTMQGQERANLNDCVRIVANAEEKTALEREARQRNLDAYESRVIKGQYQDTFEERRKIFLDHIDHDGIIEKTVYKTAVQLTQQELEEAGRIFDKIYGRILDREGVRAYLETHPGQNVLDLFKVGDMSVRQYLNKPDASVAELKAEILRLSMSGAIPLYRDIVRKNQEGQYVISGREFVGGFDVFDRITELNPELQSIDSFKRSARNTGVVFQAGMTEEDWRDLYENQLRNQAERLFDPRRVTSLNDYQNVYKSNPLVLHFKTMETVFGPRATFVKDWEGGNHAVYDRAFKTTLPDLLTEDELKRFDSEAFTTIAYLATQADSAVDFQIKDEDYMDGLEEGLGDIGRRMQYQMASAFFGNKNIPINRRMLENFVIPARKKAAEGIQSYLGANQDPASLADLMTKGLTHVVSLLKAEENIMQKGSRFDDYLNILVQTDKILNSDGNANLKNAVLGRLTEIQKEEIQTLLRIHEMKKEYYDATNQLSDSGNPALNYEAKMRYAAQISAFYEISNIWQNQYSLLRNQLGDRIDEIDAKMNAATSTNLKEAYEFQKTDLIERSQIAVAPNIRGKLLDANYANNRENLYQGKLRELNVVLEYIMTRVREYRELKAIPVQNEKGDYIVTPEEKYRIHTGMTDAEYLKKEAFGLLSPYLDDDTIRLIKVRFNENPANKDLGKITISSMAGLYNDFGTENESLECMEAFLREILVEVAKKAESLEGLGNRITALKTPKTILEEDIANPNRYRRYQKSPYGEKVDELIEGEDGVDERLEVLQDTEPKTPQIQVQIQKLEETKEELLRIKNNVVGTDRKIGYDYFGKRENPEEVNIIDFSKAVDGNKEYNLFRNGAFKDVFENKNAYLTKANIVGSETLYSEPKVKDSIRELREHPVTFTNDKLDAVRVLIEMMDSFGMIDQNGDIAMEDPYKIYAYKKLGDSMKAIENALERKDYEHLKALNDTYDNTVLQYRVIFNYIKQHFPNQTIFPGNLESNRNPVFPPEFVLDPATESVMNSIYILANHLKSGGVTLDEFMNNPVTATEKICDNRLAAHGFDSIAARYATVGEFFNACTLTNDEGEAEIREGQISTKVYKGSSFAVGFERPAEFLVFMQTDPDKRTELSRQMRIMSKLQGGKVERDEACLNVLYAFNSTTNNRIEKEARERMKKGLKCAILEGGPVKKKHMPVMLADEDGVPVADTLNYEEVLARPNQYAGLTERYRANIPAALDSIDDTLKPVLEGVLFDYLEAHPEDMEKREYKEMERLALQAHQTLGFVSNRSTSYYQFKERFRNMSEEFKTIVQPEEKLFNQQMVAYQKSLKNAMKELDRAREHLRDTTALRSEVTRIQNEMKNTIDYYRMKLNTGYTLSNITKTYLKKRNAQLDALVNNPRSTEYLRTPEIIAREGADRYADCKIIADRAQKRLWPEHLKNLETFKKWYAHTVRKVSFLNELSEEEWKNTYDNELRRYTSEHVAIPEGIKTEAQLLEEIEKRNKAYQNTLTDNELIRKVTEGAGEMNDPADEFEDLDDYQHRYETKLEQFRGKLSEAGYLDPAPAANPPAMNNARPAVDGQPQPGVNEPPFKEQVYRDIAEIVANGIVANRDGRVPGHNMQAFVGRIASDPMFKAVLQPILAEVRTENAGAGQAPLQEGEPQAQQAEADIWKNRLAEMLKNRAIVSAYAMQKEKPENNAGVNFMKNQIAQVKDPAQFKAFSYKPNQPQAAPPQQQGPGMH